MGDILPNSPDIQKPELQQHEIVLRLFVTQLNTGYKDGWLYYKCKEKDLLSVYNEYRSKGFFNLLKSNAKDGFDKPKLTIELVPKTCWFSNVRSNVTPSQWNKLKKYQVKKQTIDVKFVVEKALSGLLNAMKYGNMMTVD